MLKANKYPADYKVKAIVRTTSSPSKCGYCKRNQLNFYHPAEYRINNLEKEI